MKIKILFLTFLSCISFTTLYASNYSFMHDSAIFHFDDNDTTMMSANIQYTLDRTRDGKKSIWKNPNTHAWGYAIPSRTVKRNGTTCRALEVFNEADKVRGTSSYTFCKIKGEWKAI